MNQDDKVPQTARETPEALQASEARYRRLFETAPDGILILDADTGKIVDVNPLMEKMLGHSLADLLGQELWEIGLFEDATASKAAFLELQGKGHLRYEDVPLKTATGQHLDVDLVSSIYLVNDKEMIQCNIRDITERKRLEEQLRQSQTLEGIGLLAGTVAHDFNNLLTIILGNCDLLSSRLSENDPLLTGIKQIRKCGDRATNLTRPLLAFSRKQALVARVLDLNALVSAPDGMLRRQVGEGIDLKTALASDLGRIKADPEQIEQVIINLVVNARDAMTAGGTLTLETANVNLDQDFAGKHLAVNPGPYVMLAVSDTGGGIDPAIKTRIFEPFFTTKAKGPGLGLSTVYGIVKQSGGSIWCESERGRGTTFKVYLPRVEEEEVAVTLEEQKPAPGAGGSETVLVAEDEEMVGELVMRMLTPAGYKVIVTKSGTEALRKCEMFKGPIDLLVTDMNMPGMSGNELRRRVTEIRPGIKVLLMSGYTEGAVERQGMVEEGTAFLMKPFTRASLNQKVRETLDGRVDRLEASG